MLQQRGGWEILRENSREEEEEKKKKLGELSRATLYFCFLSYSLHLGKAIYVS